MAASAATATAAALGGFMLMKCTEAARVLGNVPVAWERVWVVSLPRAESSHVVCSNKCVPATSSLQTALQGVKVSGATRHASTPAHWLTLRHPAASTPACRARTRSLTQRSTARASAPTASTRPCVHHERKLP
eukprot:351992-Chlamydomonas_euryale.AAC.6